MSTDYIWGLSGDVKEGEILSFISDDSETFRSQDEMRFEIRSVLKREDGRLELQGIAFCEMTAARPAILILDPDYDGTSIKESFNSIGELRTLPS